MNKEEKEKLAKTCEQISEDMENDAKNFDGKPFNGKTVGTYFGYQCAAIATLADILKQILTENQ